MISKSIFSFVLLLAVNSLTNVSAQIRTAFPSPLGKVYQRVGLTDVEIEYSRPRVKGRKVFGSSKDHLIKYGSTWITGANAGTTISFSTNVKVNDRNVEAGKYAIYTIPDKTQWTIILYRDLTLGGNTSAINEKDEALKFTIKPRVVETSMESLTFILNNVTDNSLDVELSWADTRVSWNVSTEYERAVMDQIAKELENPFFLAASNFSTAAAFYLNYDKDLNKALEWVDEALRIRPNMFDFDVKADILIKLNKPDSALAALKEAHQAGQKTTGGLRNFYETTFKHTLDKKAAQLKK